MERRGFFRELTSRGVQPIKEHLLGRTGSLERALKTTALAEVFDSASKILTGKHPPSVVRGARSLVRLGAPINSQGVLGPRALKTAVLLELHPRTFLFGIPTTENPEMAACLYVLQRDGDRRWVHAHRDADNKVFMRNTQAMIESATIDSQGGGKMQRRETIANEIGPFHTLVPTGWGTALCLESDGYVVEFNPLWGSFVKRASLGMCAPLWVKMQTAPGAPVVLEIAGAKFCREAVMHDDLRVEIENALRDKPGAYEFSYRYQSHQRLPVSEAAGLFSGFLSLGSFECVAFSAAHSVSAETTGEKPKELHFEAAGLRVQRVSDVFPVPAWEIVG